MVTTHNNDIFSLLSLDFDGMSYKFIYVYSFNF